MDAKPRAEPESLDGLTLAASRSGIPAQTERLTFREMESSDLDDLAGQMGDRRVFWMLPKPYSVDEARDWLNLNRGYYQDLGFGTWIISLRATGRFAGECGFAPVNVDGLPEIEIGYDVLPDLWGQGLASEAAAAAIEFARSSTDLDRVVALIDPRNARSMRTASRIGFSYERDGVARQKVYRVFSINLDTPYATTVAGSANESVSQPMSSHPHSQDPRLAKRR